MCWKDGFSIKWLAIFSSSMAKSMKSQYLCKPKCALKTLYKTAFGSIQNGSFWCPKVMMSSTKNGKAFSNPMFTTNWHPPTPFFFPQNGGLYEGQPHPFCGGNGKEVGRTAFCRKGLRPTIETCFVRKSCAGRFKIAILQLQFSTIEPHFVRNGCDRHFQFAIFL